MAKVMTVEHVWTGEGAEADIELHWRLIPDQNCVLLATLMRWRRLTCTLEDTEELLVDVQWVIPSTALNGDIPDFKRVKLRPEQWHCWVPDLVIDGPHSALLAQNEVTCRNNAVEFDWRQWAQCRRNL